VGNCTRMEKEKYMITTETDTMPVKMKIDFGPVD
jgi:hypothetical protein